MIKNGGGDEKQENAKQPIREHGKTPAGIHDVLLNNGLDATEIEDRKAYLELTDDDVDLLKSAHAILDADKFLILDAFYAHLLTFPALDAFIGDSEKLARLKRAQAAYFESMTAGEYDEAYIANRLRIGATHQKIGLDPKWYIGAYRKYLSVLTPILWRELGARPAIFMATCDALLKVVSFDMGLALDTYAHADRESIIEQQNHAEHIFNNMPCGLIVADAEKRIRSLNIAMKGMLGLGASVQLEGQPLSSVVADARLLGMAREVLATGRPRNGIDVSTPHGDGETAYDLSFDLVRTTLAGEQLLLLIAQDRTPALASRQALSDSEERFRLTFDQADVGLMHLTPTGRLLRANPKLQHMLGYTEAELRRLTLAEITSEDDVPDTMALLERMAGKQISGYKREKRYIRKNGDLLWVNVSVSSMKNNSGEVKFIAVVEDISKRKQAEEEIRHMAAHDALTDLPNRTMLQDWLSRALIQAQRAHRHVAVLFVDLDRFKNVNDSLGHEAGDQVIVEAARRLTSVLRAVDIVTRQGGDEFVIALADIKRQEEVTVVAQKILTVISAPMVFLAQELTLTCSIGVAMYPRDGRTTVALLKNADTAMYQAKATGRARYAFYEEEMNKRAMAFLKMENALRRAIEMQEFALHYQPLVDIKSGRIVGFEALLRWFPPLEETVYPGEFIGVAEETGLIIRIGEWVLETACRQIMAWRELGQNAGLKMSVNLSASQFRQLHLLESIRAILALTACDPQALVLEITESVIMEQHEVTADILRQIHAMGIGLAIDDFGTGYSSLSYLKRFPIHTLKIDRSFIHDLTALSDDAAIVGAVIGLGHAMNRNVVAEGVETREQLAFLAESGCDQAQGYYFGRAVPAEAATALLREPSFVCADKNAIQLPVI
jgi:diguanylate cyclase (GGDEF)-like protein/PAS domain S-box-containing protein